MRCASLSLLVTVVFLTHATQGADLPNIILCMADDQGYGDVGYYGASDVKTPVLDEMSRTALRFDRFYAVAPVCSPTRASVLTGRHPNRMACFSWGHSLRPQETTIAEALHQAGYMTGHFGKWHLGSVRADSPVCPGNSGFDDWLSSPNFYENDPLMSHRGRVISTKGESSRVPVDFALDFMREAGRQKKPFLAVIWFGSPHAPHIATEEFLALYADQKKALSHFLGELSGIDAAMGHLRTSIRDLGIADNTLLWYTSDNGALPNVGSTAGLSGRKGDLYEGGIRVPAIIEWPAVIQTSRITTALSGTVDIYPTLLEVAGVTVQNQPVLDGQSLLPLIRGGELNRRQGLGFWVYPKAGIRTPSHEWLLELHEEQEADDQRPWHAVEPVHAQVGGYAVDEMPGHSSWIDGRFKLHRIPRKDAAGAFDLRLFDLESDAQEKTDLAAAQHDRAAAMQKQLVTWQRSVIRSLNGEDYVSR